MASVLLVSPPYYKAYSRGQYMADSMPSGLGYIASYLQEKNRAEVKIIDFGICEYSNQIWANDIVNFKPNYIGFSTLTLGYQQVIKMAKIAREINPDIILISGGPHATVCPEDMLEYCDIVIQGEGEETFSEVISGRPLAEIEGITYRVQGQNMSRKSRQRIHNLDDLPFPAYDKFNMSAYKQHGIMGSRGCPFACSFCASPVLWGRVLKLRTAANILDEIQMLHEKYGIKTIVFQDDTFNLKPERGIAICDEIIKRRLNESMSFTVQMRANKECVSPALFFKMKEANCTELTFGIESGSDKVLEAINKNLTASEARNAIRMARNAGISHVKGFFMIGNWKETPVDILRTWYFIAVNPVDTIFTASTPLPGTTLYEKSKASGYIKTVDWSKVDWVTPISRTDKLPKSAVKVFYFLTVIFIHFPAHIRSGNAKGLLKSIWNFGLNNLMRMGHPHVRAMVVDNS